MDRLPSGFSAGRAVAQLTSAMVYSSSAPKVRALTGATRGLHLATAAQRGQQGQCCDNALGGSSILDGRRGSSPTTLTPLARSEAVLQYTRSTPAVKYE